MSKIYLEILDDKHQEVFKKLSNFKKEGYLAGGTALALQIKHRKSVDFDVFVASALSNRLKLKIRQVFGLIDVYTDTSDQISFYTHERIGVTFVWYYYNSLFDPIPTSSISLASVYDIVADKAHTIGRRAIWRDYVDFFLLLKNKIVSLEKIIKLAKEKFGGEFNETLFLEQLSYFGDLTPVQIDFIGTTYTPPQIKSFLENQVEEYLKRVL